MVSRLLEKRSVGWHSRTNINAGDHFEEGSDFEGAEQVSQRGVACGRRRIEESEDVGEVNEKWTKLLLIVDMIWPMMKWVSGQQGRNKERAEMPLFVWGSHYQPEMTCLPCVQQHQPRSHLYPYITIAITIIQPQPASSSNLYPSICSDSPVLRS